MQCVHTSKDGIILSGGAPGLHEVDSVPTPQGGVAGTQENWQTLSRSPAWSKVQGGEEEERVECDASDILRGSSLRVKYINSSCMLAKCCTTYRTQSDGYTTTLVAHFSIAVYVNTPNASNL